MACLCKSHSASCASATCFQTAGAGRNLAAPGFGRGKEGVAVDLLSIYPARALTGVPLGTTYVVLEEACELTAAEPLLARVPEEAAAEPPLPRWALSDDVDPLGAAGEETVRKDDPDSVLQRAIGSRVRR